jgi:ubiquinone/menaquinone biosynthesis C-methylase UbiE
MGCHGGFALDEKTRRAWYNPDQILSESGLQAGMTFADVGSGEGFFSILAAEKIGKTGKVYSVDTDAEAISRLKRKATERGLANIQTLVDEAEGTVFCKACIDVVFFSMVLHDFHDPIKVLQNAKTMLKPSGVLVDLDWKKKQMPFGPPIEIRFSEEKTSELLHQAGFHVLSAKDVGPHHYVVTAKP